MTKSLLEIKVKVSDVEAVKSLLSVLCEHLDKLPEPVIKAITEIKEQHENEESKSL